MPKTTFGELCEDFRLRRGISKAELARRLNVTRSTVSYWLNDSNVPENQTLLNLAKELGLSYNEKIELFKKAGKEELVKYVELENQSSLPKQETTRDISSTQRIIPLQRPPRVPYFTGREKEIDQILKDLKPGRVITLVGPGGIGKSAIAAEVVWQLAPEDQPPKQFSDGIVHYNFYAQSRSALALEHIARSFGEELASSAEAAAKRALSGRRVLLLLEGTENTDDLQKILAVRDSCGVLITSRSRKDIVETRLDILPLPIKEAVNVLKAWGGTRVTNNQIAEQICNLVGELPLAVRLAGRYMAEREEDGADYLAWLEATPLTALDHGQRQHESIPLLMQRSLDWVSETARQALAVAGLLALGSFSREAIAAALEVSGGEVGHMLGELVRYSLLARPGDWYEVTHTLVHTYARERMATPEIVRTRSVAYYIKLATEQSELGPECYTRLDAERAHIMAMLAGCINREDWKGTLSLSQAIHGYLAIQGHSIERTIVCQAGLRAAQALKAQKEEAIWLRRLGDVNRYIGEIHGAIPFYEQALGVFHELGDQQGKGEILRRLGVSYHFLGEVDLAIKFLEQSLAIAQAFANRHEEAASLNALGIFYRQRGQTHQAILLYQQALTITRETGDQFREGQLLGNLGVAYGQLGEIRRAITFYTQSLEVARAIADQQGEAANLNDLGFAYANVGEIQQAILFYQQSLAMYREIGDREGEGLALLNLGEAYVERGEAQRALEYHKQSLAIVREIEDYCRKAGNLTGLGRAYTALGDAQRAITYCEQAVAIAREIKDRYEEGKALATLGTAHALLGEEDQAITYFDQAIMTAREINNRYKETRWTWDLGLLYEKRGAYEQAAALMAITVEYERTIRHTQARSHMRRLQAVRRKAGPERVEKERQQHSVDNALEKN